MSTVNLKLYQLKEIGLGKLLLYLFPVMLYLPMIGTNIVTILLFLIIIFNCHKENFNRIFRNKIIIYFITLFLMAFLGFLYKIELKGVFNDIEKKLSFVILPIAIYLIKLNKDDIKIIFSLFFLTGFFATLIALVISFLNYRSTGSLDFLFNHNLSESINFHATYLSTYLLSSLAFPIFYYKKIKKSIFRLIIVLFTLCILFFLILLSVRIVWLCMFIIGFTLSLGNKKYGKIAFGKNILYIGFLLSIIALAIYSFPPSRERFKEAINYNNEYNTDKVWGGRGMRGMIWSSSLYLLKENVWLGLGSTKEVQKELNNIYIKRNYGPLLYMMKKNGSVFNAHNQYLEEVLKFGTIFGFFFPLILALLFYLSIKYRLNLLLYVLIVISCVSFTETILELNKGIIFFSFFIPVICLSGNTKTIFN